MNDEPELPRRKIGPYEQSLLSSRAQLREAERRAARRRHRVLRIGAAVAAVVLVVGVAVAGVWWWKGRGGAPAAAITATRTAEGCPTREPVRIWVSPAMQSAAVALTQHYQASPGAPCVAFDVESRTPYAAIIGLGPGQPGRPDAWIPDSPVWVTKVNDTAKLNLKQARPFATSPLVLAANPDSAGSLAAAADWKQLLTGSPTVRLSDPRSTTAGMLALASALPKLGGDAPKVLPQLAQRVAGSTEDLFSGFEDDPAKTAGFPTSEADLIEHNRVHPDHAMRAVVPSGGGPSFEYSLINVATDPVRAQAVEGLRAFLSEKDTAATLAQSGLRSAAVPTALPTQTGSVNKTVEASTPADEAIAAAADAWQSATLSFRLLAAVDVSGSMKEPVGNSTRIAITQEAATLALRALPKSTDLGLWAFSMGIGANGADYKELSPVAPLSDDVHLAQLSQATGTLTGQVGGGTGLYDTIWAAYQRVLNGYDTNRVNAVVILTDGRNEKPDGLTLDELMARFAKADPKRPVPITTIGIGPDADGSALSRISKAMHSEYYPAPKPEDITRVLAKALLDHTCTGGVCA